MSYRLLAPFYALCERLIFGSILQRARLALTREFPEQIVIFGEGDGRFSAALPSHLHWIAIEEDPFMKRQILRRSPHAKIYPSWSSLPYSERVKAEALVCPFSLDCLTPAELSTLLQQLTVPSLFLTDFFPEEVSPKVLRPPARLLVNAMYRFFHILTALPAHQLPPIRDMLENSAWILTTERTFCFGFIRSQQWQKRGSRQGTEKDLC